MKIITQSDYDWKKHTKPERNTHRSRTIPDQGFTLRDILNKFTTGQPITGMGTYNEFDGEYDGQGKDFVDFDSYKPDPNTMDLYDRQLMAKQAKRELADYEKSRKKAEVPTTPVVPVVTNPA